MDILPWGAGMFKKFDPRKTSITECVCVPAEINPQPSYRVLESLLTCEGECFNDPHKHGVVCYVVNGMHP